MIIMGENIRNLLKGTLSCRAAQDGLIPLRFTDRQMAEYEKHDFFRIRSYASAGIKLAFLTDATRLDLNCRTFKASSLDLYGFDLYEDGYLTGHTEGKTSDAEKEILRISFPLSRTKPLKELYFPCLAGTVLLTLELADASHVRPAPEKPRLLCLGDSITQGCIARFPSCTYAGRLAVRMGMDLLNQGIGGDTFRPETLDRDMCIQPDVITIAYGTNDWSKKADPEKDAVAFFQEAMNIWSDKKIYVLTPIWRKDLDKETLHGIPFDAWRIRLAEIASVWPAVTVIDGRDLFPEIPELFHDGYLHPNDNGFILMADRLAGKIV